MRRPIVVTLLVLIVLAAAGILVALSLQERLPVNARAALDRYLVSENKGTSQPAIVRQVVHAARPARFDPSFSAASVGDSFYFRTTRGYRDAAAPNPLILNTSPLPGGVAGGARGERALPFPPRDLWCVSFNAEGENGRVVFLALHEDMYNADWVVYETAGAPGDSGLAARLVAVGCEPGN